MKEFSKCLTREHDEIRTKLSRVCAGIKVEKVEIVHLKQQLLKNLLSNPRLSR
jgi:hypothetical protein